MCKSKVRHGLPIQSLPAYDERVKRIGNQTSKNLELAKTPIGWITYAKRPLTVDEPEHALAIVAGSSSFGESNITYMEQMTSFWLWVGLWMKRITAN